MNIEVRAYNESHRCDSDNTKVIAEWLADKLKVLMSANCALMPYQLWIWPSNEREREILSGPARLTEFAADFSSRGLFQIAELMMQAANRAKAMEESK